MKIMYIRKIGKNKYEILLEQEKFRTYDTVMLKYQIMLKKELSEELIKEIREETKKAEVYDKAIQFLNRKLRSEREVREFLKTQGIEQMEGIIDQLRSQGFLQEDTYIEAYIHDRFSFSPDGPNKLREDLLKQNFCLEKVENGIAKIEEKEIEKKLLRLIQKKINSNHKYSEMYCKQKVLEGMQQLGYSRYMIESILEKFELDHSDILEKEARKLYQKYKSKKEGKELFMILQQKLYQKKYPIEDINFVLKKIIGESIKY